MTFDLVTLTFDLLTLKVVSESRVTWATSVPISVFLGLSVLDLGPMYATVRDVRHASSLNAPYPRGRGIIIGSEIFSILHTPLFHDRTVMSRHVRRALYVCLSDVCLSRTTGITREHRGLGRPRLAQK